MGKLRSTLTNGGVNQNISRMDAYSYTMDPIITQDLETKTSIMSDDFYSMFKKKYHSPAPAPHVYKHYYSEPPKSTTYIYKSPKPSKPHRNSNNDYDWFDGFDLFGCDDDADYDYSNESGSNESGGRRRRRNRDKKKKKKWIKILLFIAFLIAAKVCFHKMMHHYFPALDSTTGRDEELIHDDEFYHNQFNDDDDVGDGFFRKKQDLPIQHRSSAFAPNYDETNIKL